MIKPAISTSLRTLMLRLWASNLAGASIMYLPFTLPQLLHQKVIVPICTMFGLCDSFSHIQMLWSRTISSRKKLNWTAVILRQIEAKPPYHMFVISAADELKIQDPSFFNWGYRLGSVHFLQKQSSSLWDLKWKASTATMLPVNRSRSSAVDLYICANNLHALSYNITCGMLVGNESRRKSWRWTALSGHGFPTVNSSQASFLLSQH
jgi:hypothetical protein